MYFFVLQFYFLCISFIFYGFIEATTEAVHKWFHFSSTASVWLYYLVYERVFTRSVHQPLVYAFDAPTTAYASLHD